MGNKRTLTDKQNNFCLNLIEGLSQREAYIKAGYSSNQLPVVIDENAYKLSKRNDIIMRLEELRLAVNTETVMTISERKERLSELAIEDIKDRDKLIRTSNIQAIAELNKMDGIYEGNTFNITDIKIQIIEEKNDTG